MALVEQYIGMNGIELRNKEEIAIQRIREFQPQGKLYLLPFSGGKDSLVCFELARMAGVEFISLHAPTVEHIETMRYIKKYFPSVIQVKAKKFTNRAKPKFIGKSKTMFNLIASRAIPPTRMHPYCCSDLKENVGDIGDVLITGVRWEESRSRKDRTMVEFFKGKTMVRPIIDWTAEEVWEFIKKYNLPYNQLYDEGYKRVGCPGCPKASNQKKQLEENPRWYNFYLTAFKHMLENVTSQDRTWETPQDVMDWWLNTCDSERKVIKGQIELAPCEYL